jgi:poly(A) polymerase
MLENGIFAPILPEIERDGVERLARLIDRERVAGAGIDPLRRFGALLPQHPSIAAGIAQRLKLSRAATRRLEQGAAGGQDAPRALAYRFGSDIATDIILRGDLPDDRLAAAVASLAEWQRPRMPIGGGDLIARGLRPGPVVAATLQAIERRWIAEDFPGRDRLDAIVDQELALALRDII